MSRHFNNRRNTSPVFTCFNCGHKTRLTSNSDDCCEICYELGGIDNFFNDSDRDQLTDEGKGYLATANELIERLRANAGDEVANRAKATCPHIWK